MAYDAIAMVMIGFMFWPIYVASTLTTKDDRNNAVPLMVMTKIILYALSGFTAFFNLQLALGISIDNTYSAAIERTIGTVWWLSIILVSIILIMILYGVAINVTTGIAHRWRGRGR